jgi:hypothetical protein
MARWNGAGRLVLGGGVVFCALWLVSFGGVAHANCAAMPDDPMCSPPPTSPPATQPPQQNTHTSSVSNSNSNTPAVRQTPQPRVVVRTPARESVRPRTSSNFQPAVPAAPTENFQPPAPVDALTPLPVVELGAVPIAAGAPQPQPAPAPPAPPAPKDDLNFPAVAVGGLIGGVGLSALDRQRKRAEESDADFKVGAAQIAGGAVIAIASSVAGTAAATAAMSMTLPFWMAAGIAVGIGVGVRGVFNVMDAYPKSEATGAAAHAGSVRG